MRRKYIIQICYSCMHGMNGLRGFLEPDETNGYSYLNAIKSIGNPAV